MTYRPIRKGEVPIVADIQARAFRGEAGRYIEAYRPGGRIGWRDLRLLEDQQGQAVAALAIFYRPMSLGGGRLQAGLVGSVAVPPEQRRRGHGRRLMAGLLEELHRQETPISLLFPFSAAWYHQLGFGMANFNWMLELPPRLLPDFPERREVRRAGPEDEAGIRACYEAARRHPGNNGWLERTDWEWQNRLWKPEHERVVYGREGQIEGYLVYTLGWDKATVIEWVWTSDAAWRGLAGQLAALGEQARQVSYNARQGDPLSLAMAEPYNRAGSPVEFVFYPVARLVSGFMLRVVHLTSALLQRRYPADVYADFALEVDDPQLPANSQAMHVHIENGGAAVSRPTSDSPLASPRTRISVRTNIATFSQLYAGVITAEQARIAGQLEASDDGCTLLTTAFAAAPLHMWQADWF